MNHLQTHTHNYLEYCRHQKRLDSKTLKAYRIDLRQFSSQISNMDVADITPYILEDYISGLCPSLSSTALETSSGSAPKFSIRDFYLWAALHHPIYGINDPNLRLLDVGKVGSLNQASDFLATC